MSTPDSRNIYVGAGKVYFNRFDTAGAMTQWRDLGEVSKLELTTSVDTIDKKSSRTGSRGLVARVVTGSAAELSMTMDEWDPENVAMALLGVTAAFSQTTGTATDQAISGTTKKGYGLSTGKLKIVVTAVKVGATTLVLGTDYSVDSDAGIINILPGAGVAVPDGSSITWSGSHPTITSVQAQALAQGIIQGSLRFVSAADAYGPRWMIDVWKVQITPDGAVSLLAEQYGELNVKGSVLQDSTKAADNQYFQAVKLN